MKLTWAGEDFSSEMDEWEPDQQYSSYAGDRPPKGVYQFKLVRLEQTISAGGFDQLIAHWELAPHKADHRKFKGYYMRDYLVVKEDGSTAFRVRPFLDALGVTAKQLRNNAQGVKTDRVTNNGDPIFEVTKIGRVDTVGALVMCRIAPDTKRNPEYEKITYLGPAEGNTDAGTADDSDDDGSGTDDVKAPF